MKKSGVIILAILFSISLLTQDVMAQKVLHLITALDLKEAELYIPAFEKETGIKVEWVRMSSGEVLARLKAESKNPQMSVSYGGPHSDYVSGAAAGLYEAYKPKIDFALEPPQRDKDYKWVGYYFGAIGFASNMDFLKKNKMDAPTSWNDLLKPEFKSQISIAYPYTSGTAYTTLVTLVQLMGEDKAFDYWKKLDKNMHHYNKSGSACVTQAGLGEIGLGIAFSHDILAKGAEKGYPIRASFPKEGTGFEIGSLALIKGAPEAELGKKFMDWALSVKAQNLFQEWYRIPLNPKATVAKGAITKDKVKLISFDEEWAGKNRDRLIDRWRSEIGK